MADPTMDAAGRSALRGHYTTMMRRGVVAALLLAVLSIVEYIVATQLDNPTWYLVPFVLVKAAVILDVFMHVRAWNAEGAH